MMLKYLPAQMIEVQSSLQFRKQNFNYLVPQSVTKSKLNERNLKETKILC